MSDVNIVVCLKQVPDTWAEKKLRAEDNTLDRDTADAVMNELDEYAVEEALQLTEKHGGEVTVLSMGPQRAGETIRKALQMGAHKGIHILDPALHGSDALSTSLVLAKALERSGNSLVVSLVVLGSESTDARMSVLPAMLAERLGWPQLTLAGKVEVDGETVRVQRLTEDGYQVVEGPMPAVVSVVEKINEPRYPSFKGIMAAKKKPVETVTLSDLGLDVTAVGTSGAATAVVDFADRPPRRQGVIVKDDGTGGEQLAEYLAAQKFL